jgi:hypothetical protein
MTTTIIQHIAEIIARHPGLTTTQIAERTGIRRLQCRNALTGLVRSRRVHCVIVGCTGHWYIGEAEKPDTGIARPDRINKMTGQYTCPELRTTPYRPGAMDAFNVPSRGF